MNKHDDYFLQMLDDAIDRSTALASSLEESTRLHPCLCKGFAYDQLRSMRRQCQELNALLQELITHLLCYDALYECLNKIIFAQYRVRTALDDLTEILENEFCNQDDTHCQQSSLTYISKINILMALHNLIVAAKFLVIP